MLGARRAGLRRLLRSVGRRLTRDRFPSRDEWSHAVRVRILVVDDEPGVRVALERALRLERYDVELAADGRGALDALAERGADAVVLDVGRPGLEGLGVCRRLRAAGERVPVLMLTARDAIDDRVAGLD